MTPQEHYNRAEELVQMIEDSMDRAEATIDGIESVTRIAAIHATLALYRPNPEAAGEAR